MSPPFAGKEARAGVYRVFSFSLFGFWGAGLSLLWCFKLNQSNLPGGMFFQTDVPFLVWIVKLGLLQKLPHTGDLKAIL